MVCPSDELSNFPLEYLNILCVHGNEQHWHVDMRMLHDFHVLLDIPPDYQSTLTLGYINAPHWYLQIDMNMWMLSAFDVLQNISLNYMSSHKLYSHTTSKYAHSHEKVNILCLSCVKGHPLPSIKALTVALSCWSEYFGSRLRRKWASAVSTNFVLAVSFSNLTATSGA